MFRRVLIVGVLASCCALVTVAEAQSFPYLFFPISDAERDLHAEWLMMSEAQEAALTAIHSDYVARWKASHEDLWAEQSEAVSHFNQIYHEGLQAESLDDLLSLYEAADVAFDIQDRLWPKLIALDESYFAAILPLLTDPQVERMARVRNGRLRTIYAPTTAELPAASVDPFTLIQSPRQAEEARRVGHGASSRKFIATEDEWKSLEPAISAREPQYVQALVRVARSRRKAAMDRFLLMDLGRELRVGSYDQVVRDELERDRAEIRATRAKMIATEAKHLERVTSQILHAFMATLSPSRGDELEALFLQKAYPDVLPDPANAESLFEAATKIESLAVEQRDAIRLTLQIYRRLHAEASREMIECVRKRRLIQLEGADSAALAAEHDRLADLAKERLKLNGDQRRKISMYLEPDQLEQLPEWDPEKIPRHSRRAR